MKSKYIPVFMVLVFTVSAAISAQNLSHVSQLRTETRNNLIRITWEDSPDARGPVHIYRSARPFSGTIPANIRPIVVRYGAQYYIDDIEDMNNIFYFVAASDNSGRIHEIIIPYVNSVGINLAQGEAQLQSPVLGTFESMQGSRMPDTSWMPSVTNLWTRRDGDRVIITYTISSPEKNVILYRSMSPVSQPQDLLGAVIVQSGVTSPFVDFPVPGRPWYYAVIFEDEISNGNIIIRPGINATTSAIIIYDEREGENFLRPIPLPFLTLNNYVSGGFLNDDLRKIPLSEHSVNILENTHEPRKAPLELKTPRVFSVDLQYPANGEESGLFQIVKEYFEQYEWEGARVSLQNYLSLPRPADVETRARFYLGQAQYYTGNYREALWEFLFFRSVYPDEANSWVDAVLAAMVY